jgi:2-amino-4-hydroxy-6-hydroxymethyldihydropteridine diphosphokinase
VTRTYVGIGSNMDDPVRQVRKGIDALRALGEVALVSSLYRTAPWGKTDQPEFVNAAVALDTNLRPRPLLHALKWLESELGRDEQGERWGPRRIDFDILAFGNERIDDGDLVIPHPRLHERAFALVPLAEIAPSYAAMRDALSPLDRAGVNAIGTAT